MENSKNQRLSDLRKSLGMTMEAFGKRIGMSKQSISNIESGRRDMTERMKIVICREFGVSERWLETGEGEMFQADTEEGRRLKRLIDETLTNCDDKFRTALLETILQLSTEELEAVKKYAEKYLLPALDVKTGHTPKEGSGSPPDADAGSLRQDGQSAGERTGEPTIEEKVEAYRQALLEEEALKGAGKVG